MLTSAAPSTVSPPALSDGKADPIVIEVTGAANVIVSAETAPGVPPGTWACSAPVRLANGKPPVATRIASRSVITPSRALVSALLLTWIDDDGPGGVAVGVWVG